MNRADYEDEVDRNEEEADDEAAEEHRVYHDPEDPSEGCFWCDEAMMIEAEEREVELV